MEFVIEGKIVSYSIEERAVGNCRVIFRWEGKKERLPTGKKKAREVTKHVVAEKLQEWLKDRKKGATVAAVTGEGTAFKKAMEGYLALVHAHNTEDTRDGARGILENFGRTVGWPEVRDITRDTFRAAMPELMAGRKPKTWANHLAEISRFAEYLVIEDMADKDFTLGVKPPPSSSFGTREAIYQDAWYKPILDELPHEWRAAWTAAWFTGMDSKDIWELEPMRDIIPAGKSWKIWKRRSKSTKRKLFIDQPLASQIKEAWLDRREACKAGDRLIENASRFRNAKLWGAELRKAVHAAQKRLGLPLLDVKTTRHTFATRHVLRLVRGEKNAPSLDEIRRWLGHARDSRVLEKIYAKLSSQPELMD